MSHRNELIAALDRIVAQRSLLEHPFYQEWSAGTLPLPRLRNYAAQYYRHVAAFPRYLSAIHSQCENLEVRQALLENLIDEERGPDNHPELWLRFADGLGVSRDRVFDAQPLPGTLKLVDTFTGLCRDNPLEAGLAALYVYESQFPAVAAAKIDGLKRFYSITDDRSLSFFTTHQKADVYHAQATAVLLERLCTTQAATIRATQAADTALSALWGMLDGV